MHSYRNSQGGGEGHKATSIIKARRCAKISLATLAGVRWNMFCTGTAVSVVSTLRPAEEVERVQVIA